MLKSMELMFMQQCCKNYSMHLSKFPNLFMFTRSIFSVPLALFFSFLHIACCILPLLSLAAGSAANLIFLTRYKSVFTSIQLLMFGFILTKLIGGYVKKWPFHGKLEKVSYQISLVIVAAGLLIGYFEPFKTEEQQIARQQFQLFKTHRKMEFTLTGTYDAQQLRKDMEAIGGVKPHKIEIRQQSVALVFRSDQVSGSEILRTLREKGYAVALAD